MTSACNDIRIVDLSSGRAGGVATQVLADFGAEVIKVEPPGGDPARSHHSWPLWLRGKQSVTLDLTNTKNQQELHALVRGADVVVASYGTGEAEKHGADYATLSKLNPGLVYCSVTTWGTKGPYKDYPNHDEALVAAKAGRIWSFEHVTKREGPSFAAVQIGTHAASQTAVAGILAALHARERTGLGQFIETSQFAGMIPFENTLLRQQMEQIYPERMAAEPMVRFTATSMSTLGYQPILTKDGKWIQFANLLEHLFQASIIQLGLAEEIFSNPDYEGAPNRVTEEAREEIRNMMLSRALEKTADEWMEIFRENEDVAADRVGTAQDALYHPDLVANRQVVEQDHPKLGKIRMAGPIVNLKDTPGQAGSPAPEAGEHTEKILAESPWSPKMPATASPDNLPPLHGVTILEFATIIATPLACSMLGDLGARVIKVEPIGGDPGRGLARLGGFGSYLNASRLNFSKESICLDLKSEEGQKVVHELIKQADFIIHNYRPGVPERLGIGYEQAKEINPDIIWLHLSGYGAEGPSSYRPGAHPIPGAVNGGALMQAGEGWPPPPTTDIEEIREAARQFTRANEGNPDPCSTMAAQTAAMLALHARQTTGKGQQVFVSMLNANQYANSEDALSYEGKPDRPTLDRWVYGTGPLRRLYRAASGWIMVSAESDEHFSKFCAATGRDDLAADARFKDVDARTANKDALTTELESVFAAKPAGEWEQVLIAAGVGCVEADKYSSSGDFWMSDPHVKENGLAPMANHMVYGEYQRWGPVVQFEKNPGNYGGGVIAGEQTKVILAELGYSDEQIADMYERRIAWHDEGASKISSELVRA
ncbi:MAG: CoA transferase [Dehalococcoidia bacterium]